MTKLDLDALERTARAATIGPWSLDELSGFIGNEDEEGNGQIALEIVGNQRCRVDDHDVRHVVANSPDVTLALVARIRELESELRGCADAFAGVTDEPDLDDLMLIVDKGTVIP